MLEEKINRLKEIATSKKYSVRISFKGLRYSIILGKTITVEDRSTRERIKWFQALGKRTLNDILKDFQLDFILLERGEEVYLFNNVDEALSFLEKK